MLTDIITREARRNTVKGKIKQKNGVVTTKVKARASTDIIYLTLSDSDNSQPATPHKSVLRVSRSDDMSALEDNEAGFTTPKSRNLKRRLPRSPLSTPKAPASYSALNQPLNCSEEDLQETRKCQKAGIKNEPYYDSDDLYGVSDRENERRKKRRRVSSFEDREEELKPFKRYDEGGELLGLGLGISRPPPNATKLKPNTKNTDNKNPENRTLSKPSSSIHRAPPPSNSAGRQRLFKSSGHKKKAPTDTLQNFTSNFSSSSFQYQSIREAEAVQAEGRLGNFFPDLPSNPSICSHSNDSSSPSPSDDEDEFARGVNPVSDARDPMRLLAGSKKRKAWHNPSPEAKPNTERDSGNGKKVKRFLEPYNDLEKEETISHAYDQGAKDFFDSFNELENQDELGEEEESTIGVSTPDTVLPVRLESPKPEPVQEEVEERPKTSGALPRMQHEMPSLQTVVASSAEIQNSANEMPSSPLPPHITKEEPKSPQPSTISSTILSLITSPQNILESGENTHDNTKEPKSFEEACDIFEEKNMLDPSSQAFLSKLRSPVPESASPPPQHICNGSEGKKKLDPLSPEFVSKLRSPAVKWISPSQLRIRRILAHTISEDAARASAEMDHEDLAWDIQTYQGGVEKTKNVQEGTKNIPSTLSSPRSLKSSQIHSHSTTSLDGPKEKVARHHVRRNTIATFPSTTQTFTLPFYGNYRKPMVEDFHTNYRKPSVEHYLSLPPFN